METPKQYYPISSQPFPEIREKGLTYIDKTDMIYEMVSDINSNYFFLSRPRRFGKTLLVTTLKAYFEGRKELFGGLAIDKLEKEWKKYPVLHFDMSMARSQKVSELESELNKELCGYERIYGKRAEDVEPNTLGGNADIIIRTDTTIYIFETKMNGSAEEAVRQIDIKNYPDRFAQYNLPIVKVGVNIDPDTRTINDWVIER